MQTKISVPYNLLESHSCEALVVTCMDFRFYQATVEAVKKMLRIKTFDLLTVPGSCLGVAQINNTGEYILETTGLSKKLHSIKAIIFVNHSTCGAYGIADAEKELSRQSEDLRIAKGIVNNSYPDLKIFTFFASAQSGSIKFIPIE
jgi:carbonic anhydrase